MKMKSRIGLAVVLAGMALIGNQGTAAPALKTAPGSKAEFHNIEGIDHYNQGHWDDAKSHFSEAVRLDPQSAEAHYNLALALDKEGDHKGATEHFKTAYDLGKNNPDIRNSKVLKAHLKMK
ncbi:MAG: hypothetical protein C4293_17495 [Nitrospiraceae bacterium]